MKRFAVTLAILAMGGLIFVTWSNAQNEPGDAGSGAVEAQPGPGGLQMGFGEAMDVDPESIEVDMDIVSYAIGQNMGENVEANVMANREFDREEFIKGLKASLNGDVNESYAVGVGIGAGVKEDLMNPQSGVKFNIKQFEEGMVTSIKKADPKYTEEQITTAMGAFQQRMFAMQMQEMQKQQQDARKAAQKNLDEANKYLAENAKKPGVKTTDTGLQIEMIEEGTGASPTLEDDVTVHYKGMLVDGTEFDSSYKRGEPTTFLLNDLVPAWKQALPQMKVGGKARLYVPPALGYGAEGRPPVIPPNAVMIFELELVDIPEKQAAEGQPAE